MSEVEALLAKAERSLASAKRMLQDGDTDFAASRVYYGFFYIAEALLLHRGLQFSRHGQVIAQFGRLFAKIEVMDKRFHRLMRRAFALRQVADYSTEPPPDREAIETLIPGGENSLRAAREHLAS